MIFSGVAGLRQPPPEKELLEARAEESKKFPMLCPSDEVLMDLRTCVTCRRWGTALENMGSLGCRFHPLPKNGPSGGHWHGPDVYECCGTSDDPRHKEFHATIGIKGCCAKDHCPVYRMPYPRRVYEKDFPSVLREKIYEDINRINNDRTNRTWADIVKGLTFKGLRIDQNDRFYLARIDEEACQQRMKHKFYRDEKVSRMVRVHNEASGEVTEMILADSALVKDSGFGGPLKDIEKNPIGGDTPCGKLEEGGDYFL